MNIRKEINKLIRYDKALMLAVVFLLLSFTLLSEFFVNADAGWYGDSWGYRKKITIQSSQVNANLTNFPVLISVQDDDLRNIWSEGFVGQIDAGDLLFTTSDGVTKIPHEIEYYYFSSGELVAWVKIPNLSATVNTDIYLYYGNETVANQWVTDGSVWDANYNAVHHLSDDCSTVNCYKDASDPSLGNHGSPMSGDYVADLDETVAKIDGGLVLDGDNDYMRFSDNADLDLVDDFTLEAWVQLSELNRFNTIFDKGAYSLKVDPDRRVVFSGRVSTTAATWSSAATLGSNLTVTSMAEFGGYLYASAQGDSGANSAIYRSTDGTNWSSAKVFVGSIETGGLTVFKDYIYAYAGSDVYRSIDGSVWSIVYSPSETLSSMAVFNNYLYVGGTTDGVLYRTLTGTVWSLAKNFNVGDLNDVMAMSVYSGQLYAAGDTGKIMVSSNGTTWSPDYTFSGDVMSLAVFDGKLFTAINTGSVLTTYYKTGAGAWTESALP